MSESVKKALANYYKRQMGDHSRSPKKKNKKPEKIVEKQVTDWCKKHDLDVSIVECKGVYNSATNTYLHGMTEPGYSDLSGNNKYGMAVYIELKAKGRRSTIRLRQMQFLVRKIKAGCFAVVVDSPEILEEQYYQWFDLVMAKRIDEAKSYLLSVLPKKRQRADDKLF